MPSSSSLLGRRAVLRAGGLLLAGLAAPGGFRSVRASGVVEIRLRSDTLGTKVWFDMLARLLKGASTVVYGSVQTTPPHTMMQKILDTTPAVSVLTARGGPRKRQGGPIPANQAPYFATVLYPALHVGTVATQSLQEFCWLKRPPTP